MVSPHLWSPEDGEIEGKYEATESKSSSPTKGLSSTDTTFPPYGESSSACSISLPVPSAPPTTPPPTLPYSGILDAITLTFPELQSSDFSRQSEAGDPANLKSPGNDLIDWKEAGTREFCDILLKCFPTETQILIVFAEAMQFEKGKKKKGLLWKPKKPIKL